MVLLIYLWYFSIISIITQTNIETEYHIFYLYCVYYSVCIIHERTFCIYVVLYVIVGSSAYFAYHASKINYRTQSGSSLFIEQRALVHIALRLFLE